MLFLGHWLAHRFHRADVQAFMSEISIPQMAAWQAFFRMEAEPNRKRITDPKAMFAILKSMAPK